MDIFVFKYNGDESTILDKGEIVDNITSVLWVERYRKAGEFTIIAPVSSNVRMKLPLGAFISHSDTLEVMVVENHEILEAEDVSKTEVKITGRSFEVILEQRIVGAELTRTWPPVDPLEEYFLPDLFPQAQAALLINDHVYNSVLEPLTDIGNQFEGIEASYMVSDLEIPFDYDPSGVYGWSSAGVYPYGDSAVRPVKRGNVYERLIEILELEDFGIKVVRPGPHTLPGRGIPGPWVSGVRPTTGLEIHNGLNRSHKVIFSYELGQITNAEYLWSIKNLKTHAIVSGKWVEVVVTNGPGVTGSDRRTMYVDASFLDEDFDIAPAGTDLSDIASAMEAYGLVALSGQKQVQLVKVEVPSNVTNHLYRRDYNIGDIVRVEGNYDTSSLARVVEFVEMEDESGESGYPTLSLI